MARAVAAVIAILACSFATVHASASYDQNLAFKMVYQSAAAYCAADSLSEWSCPACALPSFNVTHIFSDSSLNLQGYLGINPDIPAIVLAFRGTQADSLKNWIVDLKAAHTTSTYPHCNGCEVEQGFYEGHEALKAQVVPAVHYLKNLHPDLPLYVTGHSLGAALAVLSAAHIQSQEGVDVNQLYTFGLPRVGNQAFSTWFKQQIPQAIHVTHYDDVRALCKSTLTRNPNSLVDAMLDALTQIVPHVPPENFGYHHTATEVWYDVESGLNYKVCDGSGEDPSCADGVHFWDFSIDDHLVYLGVHICSCTPISWPPSGYTGDAALRGSR